MFTAILALATLSLVWVAALQWNTLEKTDETLRAAQRPWIKYSDIQIASPLTYNENGMNITLRFFLKNTGTSPAQNVFPHVFITSNMRNLLDPGEQRRKCEAVRQRPARAIEAGFTYFPGDDPIAQDIGVSIPKEEIENAIALWRTDLPFVFPVIMGCINDRFPFGAGESHQTGFIFRLSHIVGGPPNPALVGIDTSLGDIPQSDLRLTINYIGSYAD